MSQPTKKRVAVVFGGRSSEHAISCVTAGSVLQAIDRTAYDVVPIGIATDGRWVLESGDPETAADHRPRQAARRRRRARRGDPGPRRRHHRPRRARAVAAAADARRGRRGLPRAARPVGRGRHHPGDARDGRRPLRRRGRARQRRQHGQGLHEGRAGRGRAAADEVDHRDRARVVPRPGRRHPPHRRARLPGVREARARRLVDRHLQGRTTPASSPTRSRRRTATTPRRWSRSRPRAPARSSAACSRRWTARPRPACPPRSGSPATTSSTTSPPSTSPRSTPSSTSPPTCRTTSPPTLRELAARAFEAVGCEGLARVDFFVFPDGVGGRQRDQHDAGLHAAVDVPADVGGDRAWTTRPWSTG